MMQAYPAIFRKEEGGYFVNFPDTYYVTQGETLEEAKLMAGDVLYLWLEDEDNPIRPPSTIEEIKNNKYIDLEEDDIILMIEPKIYQSKKSRDFNRSRLIEDKMEEKKYSLSQFANMLKMKKGYLQKIIDAEVVPSTKEAKMIAESLDFDYEIFFVDDPPND